MRKILKVTILFCLIVLSSYSLIFASQLNNISFVGQPYTQPFVYINSNTFYSNENIYIFAFKDGYTYSVCGCSSISGTHNFYLSGNLSNARFRNLDSASGLYYATLDSGYSSYTGFNIPVFNTVSEGCAAVKDYILNPPPVYTKNPNVDEFLANTLISMGVTFQSGSDALSVASSAWDWCIDEDNANDVSRLTYDWSIDNFVSYCNAQSNNYKDWYNGYKISRDVSNGLGEYIRRNFVQSSIESFSDGVQGTLSGKSILLNRLYMPSSKSGNWGGQSESVSSTTFYSAQTITYFNGEYLGDNDNINSDEFLYTPAEVRQFIAFPPAPVINYQPDPDGNSGTGTLTDDGNGGFDFNINFPSFEWLADAINSLLNFLGNLLTTVSNFLSKIIDTLESLFSDAFESLSEFGQGFLEFIQGVWDGTVTLGNGVLPSSIWSVIQPFLMLAIGIGLLKFILRAH